MTTETTIKVYAMDDCTWYAAESLESATAAYKADVGHDDDLDPNELTDEQMDRLQFTDDEPGAPPTECGKRSFREQLVKEVANGTKFPCMFACTEY